jgi:catechol O-methyltransferase
MSLVLDASCSLLLHQLRDAALILSSLLFLPFSTFILVASYVFSTVFQSRVKVVRQRALKAPAFRPRTILVTGVGMTKGLCLARMFYKAGHNVVGADFSDFSCGKHSIALQKYYRLQKPSASTGSTAYIRGLIDIIVENDIELWVSCSGVASAVEDGQAKEIIEARTECKAVQFNVEDTQLLHEKHTFIEHTARIGLTVPETYTVTSQVQAEKILKNSTTGRHFIMKPVGMIDAARSDMTLLPMTSLQATENYLTQHEISEKSQWILQQYISGPEYCTHALIIHGVVKAFVACPSADILMHYEALPARSPLHRKMLDFTNSYAKEGGKDFTGHLSFDFMVEKEALTDLETAIIYPIECNPRAHTAVALFNDDAPSLVNAYMSIFEADQDKMSTESQLVTPHTVRKYYWVGHDLFELVLLPTLSLILLQTSLSEFVGGVRTFITHVLHWKDGTYEVWDPLPWWWLYHMYWPLQFWSSLVGRKKWSRMNVSTTKMFQC